MTAPSQIGAAELTIDLDAVAANWRLLRDKVAPAECSAVVKANAYGLGIDDVAPRLFAEGCRTFFVALPREGWRLRAILPDPVIYILDGLPAGSAPLFAEQRLRPVLGNAEEIAEWRAFCRDHGAAPAALHVDTGMNRLGIRIEEAAELDEDDLLAIGIDLVISHFASAEDPADPANAGQAERFSRLRARFPKLRASLANSSGIFLDGPVHYDLVRPGFALYGGNPTPGRPNPMRGVIRLDAPVLQVRAVPHGEAVGYNSRWRAEGMRTIATIGVGYADGFFRAASGEHGKQGGLAVAHGHRCRFVGRISMDLITLDVTHVPGVKRGDLMQLIGPDLPIDVVGPSLGTSGYEVLTSLSRRYCRRYLGAV